jgi:hypothetical protein
MCAVLCLLPNQVMAVLWMDKDSVSVILELEIPKHAMMVMADLVSIALQAHVS